MNMFNSAGQLHFGGKEIKRAKISCSSSGQNTIVSAVSGKKIVVLGGVITGADAVNAKFRTGASTDITGLIYIGGAGQGCVIPFMPTGNFETVAGEALTLNLSGAVAVGGWISYVEV